MKVLSFIGLLILLVFNQGCSTNQPIVETQYIKQPIQKPQDKPVATEYQLLQIEFNGKTYFALEEPQAKVLAVDWIMYRDWAEGNYEVLKKLYEESIK